MKTTFRNKSGLTVYALACGYVQRVESEVTGNDIRVDLWVEHGAFHVRAHDFTDVGRIDWIVEENLSDARYQWDRLVKQCFGAALKEVKADKRYSVAQEYHGEREPAHVIRFCGEWVGNADNAPQAWMLGAQHKKDRK